VTIGVVLLAAGRSRRFGSDKRQAALPSGRTVLDQTLHQIMVSGLPLRVCLSPRDTDLVTRLAGRGIVPVVCGRSELGMGETLAEAITSVQQWDAAVIALADMPFIAASSFTAVAQASTGNTIVAPFYRGQRGHPVAFGARFFGDISELRGDRGAQRLIQRYPGSVHELALPDPGILRDVDHPADIAFVADS